LNNTKSAFADSPATSWRGFICAARVPAELPGHRDSPRTAWMFGVQSAKADFVLL